MAYWRELVLTSHWFGLPGFSSDLVILAEFVVGSCLALRVFLRALQLSFLLKEPMFSNSNSTSWIEAPYENQLGQMWLPLLIL